MELGPPRGGVGNSAVNGTGAAPAPATPALPVPGAVPGAENLEVGARCGAWCRNFGVSKMESEDEVLQLVSEEESDEESVGEDANAFDYVDFDLSNVFFAFHFAN
uniref:Uncharacterized protein n=1 Tax=Ditylenchus dipsaci TaxID=166011 RepID=A0A915EQR2_9BILA